MKNNAFVKRANKIIGILSKQYPEAKCALDFKGPFQLLAVTILSAQSTDKQVNKISPALFSKFKTIKDFASAKLPELEKYVHSTGFFRNKSRNIKSAAQEILKRFSGKVPDNMDDLTALPGVARKTANVVLWNAFGKNEGIAVDTHVKRLSQRLGLTNNDSPEKIEIDLMGLFPKKIWGRITFYLIEHGRAVCDAKKPKCGICCVAKLCPSYKPSPLKLIYVIQKHNASRLHWDLRLEHDGVLKSWAIPKEPPTKAGIKRLAVAVPDHELGYEKFEGEIPAGEYGAGKVETWDTGTYFAEKFDKDHIALDIDGKKLKGRYYLIKFKGQEKNWLFFKAHFDTMAE